MSYKNENMKTIELHENGLDIQFRIRENGVVELADFSSQEVKKQSWSRRRISVIRLLRSTEAAQEA